MLAIADAFSENTFWTIQYIPFTPLAYRAQHLPFLMPERLCLSYADVASASSRCAFSALSSSSFRTFPLFQYHGLRPERPFTGVSGPEIPQESQKSLKKASRPGVSKKSRKESKSLKKVSEKSLCDTFLRLFDSFRDFLDTPGREAFLRLF